MIQFRGNQRRKPAEDGQDSGRHFRRPRVQGTQVAEVVSAPKDNRYRNIAFNLIELRYVMSPIVGIGASVLNHDWRKGRPGFKTQRGVYGELSARFHAQMYIILYSARGPGGVGDSGDHGKSHSGGVAQHGQQRRHGFDTADGGDRLGNSLGATIHVESPSVESEPERGVKWLLAIPST